MAGQSKSKVKKPHSNNNQERKNNVPSSPIEGQKFKAVVELHGIEALMVKTPKENPPLTPRSSLEELQNHQKDKAQLSECLTIMKKNQIRLEAIETGNPQSRQLLSEFDRVQNNEVVEPQKTTIKIDVEDVQGEII